MAHRINVVVSQGQSRNPEKRNLEESIVAALLMESGVEVTVIPHLYDLQNDDTGILALQGIPGDMILLCWLYDRAALWTLDRLDIRGQQGQTLLKWDDEEQDENDSDDDSQDTDDDKQRVSEQRELSKRKIYCIDLRSADSVQPYIDEIKRIAAELSTQVVDLNQWIGGSPQPQQMQRFLQPTNTTSLGGDNGNGNNGIGKNGNGKNHSKNNGNGKIAPIAKGSPVEASQENNSPGRRWYPVIDFSRCTNCMECIDFCLFGVYGVDQADTILVELPDNCRKGCPACSRVCPENAIIFPQHKTPAIAGSEAVLEGLKIDLSLLFGAPESGKSAAEIAANERDEQLQMAASEKADREKEAASPAVAVIEPDTIQVDLPELAAVQQPVAQTAPPAAEKDELDDLIDELDEMDL